MLELIQNAISKFSFTAFQSGEEIIVKNKKGQIAAIVKNGEVIQKKSGSQNLCGALVRDAIKNVINN